MKIMSFGDYLPIYQAVKTGSIHKNCFNLWALVGWENDI